MSLTLITVWLYRSGRPWAPVGIPMVIILALAGLAMLLNLGDFIAKGNYLLATIGAIILALEVWVVIEAIAAINKVRAERRASGQASLIF